MGWGAVPKKAGADIVGAERVCYPFRKVWLLEWGQTNGLAKKDGQVFCPLLASLMCSA